MMQFVSQFWQAEVYKISFGLHGVYALEYDGLEWRFITT